MGVAARHALQKQEIPMKLVIAIASLFLATSTALPALAAIPASISLRDAATAPIKTVQYRQTPRQARRNGHNPYASHNGAGGSSGAVSRQIIPGWRCVSRDLGEGNYSAYPSWEICD
jgi:hypothetical protein